MKIALKNQSFQRKNSDNCIVTEHPQLDEHIDFAIVKISGKYPLTGSAMNLQCKELIYVHEGQGTVVVNLKPQPLQAGDVILIEPGEKFVWEGELTLHISCHPAFTVDQHVIVQ
jgi:mannose-6-phosphate isomerase-like protein (cupin superfamily)